ncbi:MAG: hypothetical protein KDA21_10910, partial [Phycisphaerales bacterium]|nr:hypothetical protein [Phycisphaerales bacterium]
MSSSGCLILHTDTWHRDPPRLVDRMVDILEPGTVTVRRTLGPEAGLEIALRNCDPATAESMTTDDPCAEYEVVARDVTPQGIGAYYVDDAALWISFSSTAADRRIGQWFESGQGPESRAILGDFV